MVWFLGFVSSIGKEEHGKSVKVAITSITHVLQDFLNFSDIISFKHVFHFDVEIE